MTTSCGNSLKRMRRASFALGLLSFILLWILLSRAVGSSLALPAPWEVIRALGVLLASRTFYASLGMSLMRLVLSLLASALLSLLLSLLSWRYKGVSSFLEPFTGVFRALPPVVVLVALMMLFPLKVTPFFLVSFTLVPLLYEAFLTSLKGIDPLVLDEMRLEAGVNLASLRLVVLPLASRGFLGGLVSALGLGFKVLVMGEYLATPRPAIGTSILLSYQGLDMATVFAWALVLALIVVAGDVGLHALAKGIEERS